jgi:hypothetical protein
LCRGSGSELSTLIWLRKLCGGGNVRVHGSATGGCFAGIRVESGVVPCQFGCAQLEMSLSALLLGLAPLRVVQPGPPCAGRAMAASARLGSLGRAESQPRSAQPHRLPAECWYRGLWGHLRGIKRRAVRGPAAGHWPLRSSQLIRPDSGSPARGPFAFDQAPSTQAGTRSHWQPANPPQAPARFS